MRGELHVSCDNGGVVVFVPGYHVTAEIQTGVVFDET